MSADDICKKTYDELNDITKIRHEPIDTWSPLAIWKKAWEMSRKKLPIGEGIMLDVENLNNKEKPT